MGRFERLPSPITGEGLRRAMIADQDKWDVRIKLLEIVSGQPDKYWDFRFGEAAAKYRREAQDFANTCNDYATLPDIYRDIAVESAVAALEIPEDIDSLARTATAIDRLVSDEPYMRYEVEENDSIIGHTRKDAESLEVLGWPENAIEQACMDQLRLDIAYRLAKISAAKTMGWQPGDEDHPDLEATAMLASEALNFVQSERK